MTEGLLKTRAVCDGYKCPHSLPYLPAWPRSSELPWLPMCTRGRGRQVSFSCCLGSRRGKKISCNVLFSIHTWDHIRAGGEDLCRSIKPWVYKPRAAGTFRSAGSQLKAVSNWRQGDVCHGSSLQDSQTQKTPSLPCSSSPGVVPMGLLEPRG